jgi:rhomboid family protein
VPCYVRRLLSDRSFPAGGVPRVTFGGGALTPGVRGLIVACVGVFVLQALAGGLLESVLALSPHDFVYHLRLWQPLTYIFLHDRGNIFHIVFNLLTLWMFGTALEERWGTARFVRFFLGCGVGAGLIVVLLDPLGNLLFPNPFAEGGLSLIGTIGASGAIYGLLVAYGMMFPDRIILLFFVFPMRMRPAVLVMAAMTFYAAWGGPGSGINHVAHLGGMLVAWVWLRRAWDLRRLYANWRWERHRRRYRVVAQLRDDDGPRFH